MDSQLSFPQLPGQSWARLVYEAYPLRCLCWRITALKLCLNLYEVPVPGKDVVDLVGDAASQRLAYKLASESIVLLQNVNSTLPIAVSSRIFLTGPSIASIGNLCGGWSLAWQGLSSDNALFPHGQTVQDALRVACPSCAIEAISGVDIHGAYTEDVLVDAVKKASRSDYTVVVLGEGPYAEKQGDIDDLDLPRGQQEYVRALAATGTKVVLVLVQGRPRLLRGLPDKASRSDYTVVVLGEGPYAEKQGDIDDLDLPRGQQEYVRALAATGTKVVLVLVQGRPRLLRGLPDVVHAVLNAMLPCELGGAAIADILLGSVNPSGRLPFTYPKTMADSAVPYYHRQNLGCVVNETFGECEHEGPFGAGSSYSTFAYFNFTLSVGGEPGQYDFSLGHGGEVASITLHTTKELVYAWAEVPTPLEAATPSTLGEVSTVLNPVANMYVAASGDI
ncbi:hypothetical protein H257_03894 [Aphanomyces astaci]|uniref:beta-glucosidase n=1 Tax=Aphanomyces astaci TaxID=112090 RepID=W4H0W0_APHAT|nr:hypothetical protein H257_03894 [Aphanomyces astaci]ETV84803.1 hypothetical protein H257_03894 [Aphanomyces astaci]|eukprot:XP_009826495.1 hypothetical protein H257_03894 [Aphanomyces astaci]